MASLAGLEMWADTGGLETWFDSVCRRSGDGMFAVLLRSSDALRETGRLAVSTPLARLCSSPMLRKEEELDSGGVGYEGWPACTVCFLSCGSNGGDSM